MLRTESGVPRTEWRGLSIISGELEIGYDQVSMDEVGRMSEGVQRFEDLIAWKKARELSRTIYLLTAQRPFERDFALISQYRRASISVMNNIAEGFERRGHGEFAHFLMIAKGSNAEVRSMLYLSLDIGQIDQNTFATIHQQTEELSRILHGLWKSQIQRRDAATSRKP